MTDDDLPETTTPGTQETTRTGILETSNFPCTATEIDPPGPKNLVGVTCGLQTWQGICNMLHPSRGHRHLGPPEKGQKGNVCQ